eukprot:jgi/Chlat1/6759/Chrsp50S06457
MAAAAAAAAGVAAVLLCFCLGESALTSSGSYADGNVYGRRGREDDPPLERIAFGSCSKHDLPQPLWPGIADYKPQLWMWLGDNIYADKKVKGLGPLLSGTPRFLAQPLEDMAMRYRVQKEHPGYAELAASVPVLGTWDDHDYGINDGGKEFFMKEESRKLMLDFLDEPKNSPRYTNPATYAAYTYGPPGKRVKVLMLDLRMERDELPPEANLEGDMLGETQWTWLEDELRNTDAQIHLLCSSTQVIPTHHFLLRPFFGAESWGRFPKARKRLYNLLAAVDVPGLIMISGDVHFAELSRQDCAAGYPLYELTSSGMTHSAATHFKWPFDKFMPFARDYLLLCPYRQGLPYFSLNFGTISIDWKEPVKVRMDIRGVDGLADSWTLPLSHLQPAPNWRLRPCKDNVTYERDLPFYDRYRAAAFTIALVIVIFATLVALCFVALHVLKVVSQACLRRLGLLKQFKME